MAENLKKQSMTFWEGFTKKHEPHEGGQRYFDWEKAEQICIQNPDKSIRAGLLEDWGCTGGPIFYKGEWVTHTWAYVTSAWATPVIEVDGEVSECWTYRENPYETVPDWWGRVDSGKE